MSQNNESSSASNYQLIFDNALATYEKKTGKNLASDPLLHRLESCRSPDAVLAILREQIPEFDQSGSRNDRLSNWLSPTVKVLYTFTSATRGAVGLAYPPAGIIFAGIASLLSAVRGVSGGQDALFDIFDRIENFFRRLEAYIELPQSVGMTDIIVKVMVNVLLILALTTRELKQPKIKRLLRKQVRGSDIEDALRRLELLVQEEHRMATARDLRTTHRVEERVMNVENALQRLEISVQNERRMEAAQDLGAMHHVDVTVDTVDTIEHDEQTRSIEGRVQGVDGQVHCVDERLQGIDERVKTVDNKIDVVIDGIEQIRELRVQQEVVYTIDEKRKQLQQDLARWLSAPDPFINYNTTSGTRHKDSAMWFIRGNTFKSWKESTSLLWIYGKPGAGKSVLTSAIIQDINTICDAGSESAHIAFFFFDFKDIGKQDVRALLSSFIVQLNNQSHSFYNILFNFHTTHHHGTQQPSIDALTQCLEDIIRATRTPIYLIIDALDECPDTTGLSSPRDQVLSLVEKLVTLNLPRLHLCITSRPEIDIRTSIEPLTSPSNRISLHDQSGQRKDIDDFVRSVVYSDKNMRRWRGEDKELVIKTLSERADGMFRWVFCQLEVLRQCFPSSVRRILTELPESLDETYERILQQIPRSNRMHAHRLLQCLTVAVRPLRVTELADVLAIDFSATTGTPKVDKNLRWEDQEQAVLFACSSLVTIVDRRWGGPLVQFSHFSVKEFLTSDRLASSMAYRHHYIHLEPAHAIMAQACLGVLLHIDETTCKQTKDEYILANYAGEHFCEHVEFGNVLSHVTDGVDDLFDPHKPHFYLWLWLLLYHGGSSTDPNYYYRSFINRYPNNSRALLFTTWPPQIAPLHIVAQCGYLCLTRHLISKRPQDLHARDDSYRTPFHIAVLAGREELFQLFMKCSIDLGMRDSENQTLLHMAAYKGLTEVALTYLNRRWVIKDLVNAKDNAGQTALHIASRYHHPVTVTLLLKFGARVDAKDNNNNTSLLLATRPLDYTQDTTRVYEITQLLLEHGASVNTRGENGHTPLHVASEYNLSSLVALLLRLGAKVDARDNDGITPLLGISGSRFYLDRRRHSPPATSDAIAEVLLEHGASVHVRDENGRTPLHLASRCNLPGIVAPLLKFGADVDARDNVQMTPLFLADRETGPLLVKHGANVHLRDVCGQTPLHMASRSLIPNLVGVLLDSGADVDAQDKCHRSPLRSTLSLWEGSSKADKTRFSQVMDLLRKHGAK